MVVEIDSSRTKSFPLTIEVGTWRVVEVHTSHVQIWTMHRHFLLFWMPEPTPNNVRNNAAIMQLKTSPRPFPRFYFCFTLQTQFTGLMRTVFSEHNGTMPQWTTWHCVLNSLPTYCYTYWVAQLKNNSVQQSSLFGSNRLCRTKRPFTPPLFPLTTIHHYYNRRLL